jgi:cytochrome oxidase Cu insertion factor (SCO1/SenC/PrrC family)
MLRKVASVLLLLAGLALPGGCSGQSEEPRMTPAAANEGLSAFTPVAATAKSPAPSAGHPAPDFTLPDLEGNELSLSDFEDQVVLVNFWATW